MALFYITEFQAAGIQNGQSMGVAFADGNMISQTPLSTGAGGPFTSAAFAANTTLVRLHCDSTNGVSIKFGTAPSAATTDGRMAANTTEYYAVPRGANLKVSIIQN